mgnify:FL=1
MYKLYIAILFFFIQTISAQQLRQPFDFPILLSGNFGELRNNHFHSGIDLRHKELKGSPSTPYRTDTYHVYPSVRGDTETVYT